MVCQNVEIVHQVDEKDIIFSIESLPSMAFHWQLAMPNFFVSIHRIFNTWFAWVCFLILLVVFDMVFESVVARLA